MTGEGREETRELGVREEGEGGRREGMIGGRRGKEERRREEEGRPIGQCNGAVALGPEEAGP
jgi:hypothetical protein